VQKYGKRNELRRNKKSCPETAQNLKYEIKNYTEKLIISIFNTGTVSLNYRIVDLSHS